MLVNEIFRSVDGEVNCFHQGRMTTFLRVQGCNLYKHPCKWCDTLNAVTPTKDITSTSKLGLVCSSGGEFTVNEVMQKITDSCGDNKAVTITGGEPFFEQHRKEVIQIIDRLAFFNFKINLETNGKYAVPDRLLRHIHRENLCVVGDFKLPSSGNFDFNDMANLFDCNFVKFVICTGRDLEIAVEVAKDIKCHTKYQSWGPRMVFSPVILNGGVDRELINGIMCAMDRTDYILNVQIHKFLGLK